MRIKSARRMWPLIMSATFGGALGDSAQPDLVLGQERQLGSSEVTVHADVPYADGFVLDIYIPEGSGPFPTALTLHGVSGGKAAMEPIATALAERGWLVFNPNWLVSKRPFDGAGLELSVEAAGCALRFAGSVRRSHGGNSGPLGVIGLSAGGLAGALIALDPSEFGAMCGGAEVPDVSLFVGLEGAYLNAAEASGGLAAAIEERPDLAIRLDPRTYLAEAARTRMVLFLGDQFTRAVAGTETFLESLRSAGMPAEIRRAVGPHLASTFTQGVLDVVREERQR